MDPTCVDSLLEALSGFEEKHSQLALTSHMKRRIKQLSGELQFLQLYIGFLSKYNQAMVRKDYHLGSIRKAHINSRIRKARTCLYVSVLDALDTEELSPDWEDSVSELLGRIDTCKSQIKENCLDLLDVPSEVKFSSSQLHKFNKCLYNSLSNLETQCCVDNQTKLIELLKRKSGLLETIFDFAEQCFCDYKHLNVMKTLLQSWAHRVACVSILYWASDGKDEQVVCRFISAVRNLLLCTPSDTDVFLRVLKASRPSFSYRLLMGQAVSNLVNFLLDNGPGGLPEDTVRVLRVELVFLISFHSEATKTNKYVGDAEEVIKDFISFVSFNGLGDERGDLVGALLENIRGLKVSVKNIIMQNEESAVVNFPSTNVLGCIDFTIKSWKEILRSEKNWVPFAKNQVAMLKEELSSYRLTMEDLLKMQNRPNELELLWAQVANVVYLANNAVISFLFMDDNPLWCNLMCFSDVVYKIKLIKSEVSKNLDQQMYKAEVAANKLTYSKPTPIFNDVVGLEHDKNAMVDKLVGGSKYLSFVSIVGMAGIGKTTLARGVYLNSNVTQHFHCRAWCSVSQLCTSKWILFDILNDMHLFEQHMLEWDKDELVHSIYKFLVGRRYLIVLDNFWDSSVLYEISRCFPDNINGSRVLLTTQIHTLDRVYFIHPLHLRSVDEGWELLQQYLKHDIPPGFAEVGKQIVQSCKGLPVAIVESAKLLSMRLDNLVWWKIVARSLREFTGMEGFRASVALSYAHFPDYLDQQKYNSEVSGDKLNYCKPLPSFYDVVGLKHDEDAIVEILLRGSESLSLVSVVGKPGVGKTTLAQRVYLNPMVTHHFHFRAFCSVSQVSTSKQMLLDILSDIHVFEEDMLEWDELKLGVEIFQRLSWQRYLLVLDGIQDISVWARINFFPDDSNGSRILLTTQSHSFARDTNSYLYPLHLRSVDDRWEFLQQKLSLKDDISQGFAEVGKQIVQSCKGLGVAISEVARLLSKEVDNLDWWKIVARSLRENTGMEVFRASVVFSYAQLPEYLKPCFLYFGAFERGKVIRSKKLIQLWISEGFVVRKREPISQEDIAMGYLKELSNRSLITVGLRSSNGKIKTCQVHDFLYDFCLYQIQEESFLQAVHGESFTQNYLPAFFNHHRLSVEAKDCRGIFSSAPSNPRVQSMIISSDSPLDPSKSPRDFPLGNFKYLQVLDLEDVKLVGEFPLDLTKLILLRYLSIQCTTRSMTPQISRLEFLEVLWIKGNKREVQLPDTIWELKNLRHVDVGRCRAPCSPTVFLLTKVRTFCSPTLSCDKAAEEILRRIPGVRKLRCQFYESRNQSKSCIEFPELDFLRHLESLNASYVGKALFPRKLSFPSSLKKLTLSNFKLPWSFASVIGRLPCLEVLKLLENAFSGECWDMKDEEFLKLKVLKLQKLDIVLWTTTSYEAFPCLEHLVVQECQNLDSIPSCFGEMPTLGAIQVKWCSPAVEASAVQILEEQLDLGNEELQVDSTGYQLDSDYNISELWNL